MNKLKLIFPFLKLCFTNTAALLKNLFHFTNETTCKNYVSGKYKLPNGLPTIDILELFPGLEETIDNYSYLDGTSRAIDIVVLKQFAKRFPAGKYIEFGTWRGESISNVAPYVKEAYSMSFSDADMRRINTPESAIKASKFFSKNISNIKNIEHNTQTYDFTPHYKKFDLIFIDAEHQHKGVAIDTRNAFKLLKDENSIIVWHDYGLNYETPNWQVIRGILDGAPDDAARKKIYHISNTLCAVYMNGAFNAKYPEKNLPDKKFMLHLKAQPI